MPGMTERNIRSVNLMLAFDALMAERNVTRAAQHKGLSQPAMSKALNRLRHLLDDATSSYATDGWSRRLELWSWRDPFMALCPISPAPSNCLGRSSRERPPASSGSRPSTSTRRPFCPHSTSPSRPFSPERRICASSRCGVIALSRWPGAEKGAAVRSSAHRQRAAWCAVLSRALTPMSDDFRHHRASREIIFVPVPVAGSNEDADVRQFLSEARRSCRHG